MIRRYLFVVLTLVSTSLYAYSAQAAQLAQLACTDSTSIPSIQGSAHVSPLVDVEIETCGVVTAVAFNGYYVQDASGDGDDSTSDAIFVSESGSKPEVGTEVRLRGTVAELIGGGVATGNLSTTMLVEVEILESLSGMELPAPVLIGSAGRTPPSEHVISASEIDPPINLQNPLTAAYTPFNPNMDGIDFYESLEGMRVSVANPVAVSAIRQFGNFSAEVFVLADNGAGANPADALTSRGGLLLQPDLNNQGDQNPERVQIQFDGTLFGSTEYPAIKVGDKLDTVTGVMGYSFGNYEVQAVGPVVLQSQNLEPQITTLNADEQSLTLASYNVLNLSAHESDDDQRELIAMQVAVNLRSPDIIGLQEVQDNNGDIGDCDSDNTTPCSDVLDASETLGKLVDAIVAAGGPRYSWITVNPLVETTDSNRDNINTFGGASLGNIRNAFLYNAERVNLVSYQGLTRGILSERGVSVSTAFNNSRDPLEAVFEFNGEQVVVFNNHFSSRFGSSPIFGGPQPFVQAGEQERATQARAMHELAASLLAADTQANVVVLGDLNTFEFTDELAQVLPGAEPILNNLINVAEQGSYGYIFEGNAQNLDHIFVSSAMTQSVKADVVNVNVEFPRLFSSVVASDHEPVLGKFYFGDSPVTELELRHNVYSKTAAELFWKRIPGVDRYDVYRDGQLVQSSGAVSYFDNTLSKDNQYTYSVQAYSGSQLTGQESQVVDADPSGATDILDVENMTGSVYSASAVEIFWTVSGLSRPVMGFDIQRDGEMIAVTDGRSFFESGLEAGTTYLYTVTAFDKEGNVSGPVSIELTTRGEASGGGANPGPLPVANLSGQVYSSSALELFWQPPVSGTPAVAYRVSRNGQVVVVKTNGRSYFDSSLQAATIYLYEVRPIDADGNLGDAVKLELKTRN